MSIYSIHESAIIDLAAYLSSSLGLEVKDCDSEYVDIKRRKNDSRTYFLDRMRDSLNKRMQRDDEREMSRR